MNAVELTDLTKHYRDFTLDRVSLTLPEGCVMGLVGENGAGKTTVIKLLLGMLKRDSGAVRVLGRDMDTDGRAVKEELGVVLDEGCLEKIAVADAWRRQGVAEAILSAFIRFGRANLAFLTLEVRESNRAAIGLYEKLGFRPVGRRKNYYTEVHEDAILMTLEWNEHRA